jgi:alpha-glucosidase (family GH31 glycosyl hydrolase)
MKKKFTALLLCICCIFLNFQQAFALDGTWHDPYGLNDIYEIEPTERSPRDPVAGQPVKIRSTTWPVEPGQTVWISYTVNGTSRTDIGASWSYNDGNNSYWEADIGSFAKGDVVEYTVYADVNGGGTKSIGPFTFRVTDWEKVQSVSLNSQNLQTGGKIVFDVTPDTGNFSPKLSLSFTDDETVRFQLSPKGNANFATGLQNYTVTETDQDVKIETSKLRVTVTKNPYALEVYSYALNKVLTSNGATGAEMSWLTDGANFVNQFRDGYLSPGDEQFYGFGEHYDGIEKRGQIVETYIYNQYQNQGSRTYLAVPFFVTSRNYGLYLNTTCYSKFDMASTNQGQYVFEASTEDSATPLFDYYMISGNTATDIVGKYNGISGMPQELPKWAFGLWMSANEWDTQTETLEAMDKSITNDIPSTVLVLEQWSDENTFYVWNEATYTPVPGSAAFQNSDFTYGSKWPDPKAMADTLHENGLKLILWQIPVLKYTSYPYAQKDNDESYMIQQGYAVSDGNGGQYRIPASGWFGNSLLLDFTNPSAVNWWMSKRSYLFDDIGIDGIKTDGGEMVWRKTTSFHNGSTDVSMRNAYPNAYIKGYNDFVLQKTGEGITFSRSGTTGVQSTGAFWAGDQASSFAAFRDAVSAGLSAGISGIPFWGWDLAGFTGDFPSSELYKRSTQMAAFAPIMQFHSEKANPSPSEERSPWNVQERTQDTTIVPMFREYTNTRMNLLPYIYSEARNSAEGGGALMRAMFLDYPQDPNTYGLEEQYLFGRSLLVAPVLYENQTLKDVYLPAGDWIDFWHHALTAGGGIKSYYADVDSIPVYVKSGSILPLNLNAQYELGGSIGNDVDNYTNLTFRIYPEGNSEYTLSHSDQTTMTVQAQENFGTGVVTVTLPASTVPVTAQVFGSKPSGVAINGQPVQEAATLADFVQAPVGYYYSMEEKLTYVKTQPDVSSRVIVLNGIHKAPYEAEHASLNQVSTNTDHSGYYGEGFVDQFAASGDWVEFTVYSKEAKAAQLSVRYSAGTENGQRSVSVNGASAGTLSLPKTSDWDTWNSVNLNIQLQAGRNVIKIAYENVDFAGINLDGIFVE